MKKHHLFKKMYYILILKNNSKNSKSLWHLNRNSSLFPLNFHQFSLREVLPWVDMAKKIASPLKYELRDAISHWICWLSTFPISSNSKLQR